MAEMIRNCFIPREGHMITELDFSGVEVSVAACYHKDPVMINYLLDPASDMHKDIASQIYKVEKKDITKQVRHAGKNKFVFPEFYGSYWLNCGTDLWNAMTIDDLRGPNDIPMMEHLASKGIKKLGAIDDSHNPTQGSFLAHMKEVEEDFWGNRFKVYDKWKRNWMKKYEKLGYFETLSGFRMEGVMNRKEVINFGVQGSAFHCLLYCLIQVNKALKKYKMKTRLVGQIHDSLVADNPENELQDYLEIAQEIMTVKINQFAPWLVVPLEIEAEATPVNGSWYTKKVVTI